MKRCEGLPRIVAPPTCGERQRGEGQAAGRWIGLASKCGKRAEGRQGDAQGEERRGSGSRHACMPQPHCRPSPNRPSPAACTLEAPVQAGATQAVSAGR